MKFRAFYKPDIEDKRYLPFYSQKIDDEMFFVSPDPELRYDFQIPFVDDNWILHRWTGLVDLNGDDIYEGDIVKAYKANSYLNGEYEIVWHTRRACFAYAGNTYMPGYSQNQVIGNIIQTKCEME